MNNQLIEKIIKSHNEICPDFTYKNPLLDRNVARALSRSLVKILKISEQNSNINNNLRLTILENIRKMCKIEPEDHVNVDENEMETLTELYQQHLLENRPGEFTERQLDAFLIRRFKYLNIDSIYESTLNPEIIQALINLNGNGVYLDMLSDDIIHWHIKNENYMCVIKDLWNDKLPAEYNKLFDDIAIKMKPEIEKDLLGICHTILTNRELDIEKIFSDNAHLLELIKKCSSPTCFQICSGVLNFIFIMTNFDSRIQIFIPLFIEHIKRQNPGTTTSLYPLTLSHIVLLMDFDVNSLPESLKQTYVNATVNYLRKLHDTSENDLILLLSHYPQWFDIYFSNLPSEA